MQIRTTILVLFGIAAIALIGYGLYQFVLGPTLPPSAPSTPVPVVVDEQGKSLATERAYPSPSEAQQSPVGAQTTAGEAYPAPEPTLANAPEQSTGELIFQIVSAESTARFTIYEELRGSPKDVIGETNLVTGEMLVHPGELSQSKVGVIQINARGFATDDERRNAAIRNRILQTDAYEYIVFEPTSLEGLSGIGEVGKSYSFLITGNLTIRDVTQPVTFEVTVTVESPTRLSGSATATIRRSDFKLVVPNVPFVANVADEVKLELIFVATST
ncbi:MAG: polyisoprenoid-binding protein [Anaerolineae bacterium]|jgi:polyisoprenoid-binding protein YceI|nr:MAG: polyisoprenoid-binding protein [Anaerolineae bacterium]